MIDSAATRLRRLLIDHAPVVALGTFNALFARLIVEAGFPAVYLSGAGVANSLLGKPDVGIATMDEMVMIAERICEVVDVPVIADGDTGYGGVHNVARTVRAYERAGVAAVQLEDQVFPKKCGHFEGKEVVPAGEARGAVLLVHGMTDSPYSMRAIADIFRRRDLYVLVLRLPGHGTVPAALTRIKCGQWQAAVRWAAHYVRERAGSGPFYVGGYSSGLSLGDGTFFGRRAGATAAGRY